MQAFSDAFTFITNVFSLTLPRLEKGLPHGSSPLIRFSGGLLRTHQLSFQSLLRVTPLVPPQVVLPVLLGVAPPISLPLSVSCPLTLFLLSIHPLGAQLLLVSQ